MSGIPPQTGAPAGPAGGDPSMEDILASIRRILSEDEPVVPETEGEPPPEAPMPPAPISVEAEEDDVLILDDSMRVDDVEAEAEPEPDPSPEPEPEPPLVALPEVRAAPAPVILPPPPELLGPGLLGPELLGPELLGPEAAAAATSSVGNLMRTLATDRSTHVYRGGPTIEDVVREEVRPLLKQWLDENLPPLVERLVRIEIDRVVGRAVP